MPAAADQVALGDQLRVGLHDNPAGYLQLAGEDAARRQFGSGSQATGTNRRPQLVLQLPSKRRGSIQFKMDVHWPSEANRKEPCVLVL